MEGWAQPKTQQNENGLVGSLDHFAFSQPGKKQIESVDHFAFSPGREKAKWFRLPSFFFQAREKSNWKFEPEKQLDIQAFTKPGKNQFFQRAVA